MNALARSVNVSFSSKSTHKPNKEWVTMYDSVAASTPLLIRLNMIASLSFDEDALAYRLRDCFCRDEQSLCA